MNLQQLLLQCVLLQLGCGFPISKRHKRVNMRNEQSQISYLKKFAYLRDGDSAVTGSSLEQAIQRFQKKWSLPQTGQVDLATQVLMETSRCGVPDDDYNDSNLVVQVNHRSKRYAFNAGKWPNSEVTFKITTYTSQFSQDEVNTIVQKAFNSWGSATTLSFRRVWSGSYDIEVKFKGGDHGDDYPFDGPGSVIGHAFPPAYGGDLHMDEAETWSMDAGTSHNSFDLFTVLLHEIGHSLGLGHSETWGSVMYPYYKYEANLQLKQDDLDGIQALYGKPNQHSFVTATKSTTSMKTEQTTTTSTTTTSSTAASSMLTTLLPSATELPSGDGTSGTFCDGKIDAILSDVNGQIFAFKGDSYSKIDHNSGVVSGYPKLIENAFKNVPYSDFDAAVHLPAFNKLCCYTNPIGKEICTSTQVETERIYLFKGDQYYVSFTGTIEQEQSFWSGRIQDKFPGIPASIDSAFTLDGNEIYFTKEDSIYRITRGPGNQADDPASLSDTFKGLPSHVDAVLTRYDNGAIETDYFSGSKFYRVTDGSGQIDAAYPKDSTQHWLKC